MVARWNPKYNTNPESMTPGPHIDATGKHHLPVGTFFTMLHRAKYGNPPQAWGEKTQERFIATLNENPLFRKAIQGVLRGK